MYAASYQLCAEFSSRLIVLAGNVVLWYTNAAELSLVEITAFGTKLNVLKGRRGPSGPGPGVALLIKCARCRWNPRAPTYPISTDVFCPRLFCTDVFHCWMY